MSELQSPRLFVVTNSQKLNSQTQAHASESDVISIRRFDDSHAEASTDDTSAVPSAPVLIGSQIIAALLMLPVLPVIGALILITRLNSRGPGLYSQERVGFGGKTFTLYKIRSMRVDAEKGTGAVWARVGDNRVTRLGKFLRWSHLDELPQLFNVLKGEMCFIGPRPERPVFVNEFKQVISRYNERLWSPPGITGLAQICLPADDPDAGLKTVCDKLSLEIAYREQRANHTLLDARIILGTALKICGIKREKLSNWLGLNQIQPVHIAPNYKPEERKFAA
jgi:lipopolysaccharide/colanic/teichoic acid biosynthesis glycosyltransferase